MTEDDTSSVVTSAPRRMARSQRRDHLLDVAATLVIEGGFEAVTMEGVASRAAVSKGLGYAYFPNRDELLAALFDREIGSLDRRVAAAEAGAARGGGTFEDRLRAILVASLDAIADRGVLIGALLNGKATEGPLEHKRRGRQTVVAEYFTDMVIAEYSLTPRVGRTAVGLLLGGYLGALDLWVRCQATREEITETFVRFAIGGLQALAAELKS